jgi:hypothetical protein
VGRRAAASRAATVTESDHSSTHDGEGWIALREIRGRRSFRFADGGVVEPPVSEAQPMFRARRPGRVRLDPVEPGAWTLGPSDV